jgi:glycosyltransferase involved in cell wall biosynthesis
MSDLSKNDGVKKISEIIYFPSIGWNHSWERQQIVISHLANAYPNIKHIMIAPTGLVDHGIFKLSTWHKLLKLRSIFFKASASFGHYENKLPPNLFYYKPLFSRATNPFYLKLLLLLNPFLRKLLRFNFDKRLVFAFCVNDLVNSFLSSAKISILELNERRQFNNQISPRIKKLEACWARKSDILISDNMASIRDYEGFRSSASKYPSLFIPHGYDAPSGGDFNVENNKIAVYLGNLHNAIDYDFFKKLIIKNPDWKFRICGQIMSDSAYSVIELPNVNYCGVISHAEISNFLSGASLGLIPYGINAWTEGISPSKLFEYLGYGLPVVSTAIPEVLNIMDSRFVRIVAEPAPLDFISFNVIELREYVSNQTWDRRLVEYSNIFNEFLNT